jgi:hypothetical protein
MISFVMLWVVFGQEAAKAPAKRRRPELEVLSQNLATLARIRRLFFYAGS